MIARLFNLNGTVAFCALLIRWGVFGFAALVFCVAVPFAMGGVIYYATPLLIHIDADANRYMALFLGVMGFHLMAAEHGKGVVNRIETYADFPRVAVQFLLVMLVPWIMSLSFFRIINYYTLLDPIVKDLLAIGFGLSVFSVIPYLVFGFPSQGASDEQTVRGHALLTDTEVASLCDANRPETDPGIRLGGCRVPYKDITNGHIAAIGTTRSGKSLTIFYLLYDFLRLDVVFGPRRGISARALIFDYKGDIIPFLTRVARIDPDVIKDLHPQRQGAYVWNIAQDVTDESRADQVAAAFIPTPKEGTNHTYWNKAANAIVAGLLLSFKARCGDTWTLLDLVRALRLPKEKVADIITGTPNTRHLAYQFFGRDDRFDDVYSTVASEVKNLAPIAALYEAILQRDPTRKIGLSDWTSRNDILVLGHNQADSEMMKPLNKILFRLLSEKALSKGNSDTNRTYIFLDELSKAGPLPNLNELLTGGAGKGIVVIIGFQDFNGLKEALGENLAIEIVGMCGTYIALKIQSEETAAWVAKRFNEREVIRLTRSQNEGTNSGEKSSSHQGSGVSEQFATLANVNASDLRNLSRPSPEYGMDGYYSLEVGDTPANFFHHTRPEDITNDLQPALLANLSKQEPPLHRPDETLVTSKWTLADLKRLKLPPDFLDFDDESGAFFDWDNPAIDLTQPRATNAAPKKRATRARARTATDAQAGIETGSASEPGVETNEPKMPRKRGDL